MKEIMSLITYNNPFYNALAENNNSNSKEIQECGDTLPTLEQKRRISEELMSPMSEELNKLYYYYFPEIKKYNRDSDLGFVANHQVWDPSLNLDVEGIPVASFDSDDDQDDLSLQNMDNENNGFINYRHIPVLYGYSALPPLVYGSCDSIGNQVFLLGGLTANIDPLNTHARITPTIRPAAENLDIKLPENIKPWILYNNQLHRNSKLYVLETDTNLIQEPVLRGDIPPLLCCASMTKITARHIFYYGGFQLMDNQKKLDDGTEILERRLVLNSRCWVLDTFIFKFKEIKLVTHSITDKNISLARFGHSALGQGLKAVPIRTNTVDDHDIKDANDLLNERLFVSVFIFGGFGPKKCDEVLLRKDLNSPDTNVPETNGSKTPEKESIDQAFSGPLEPLNDFLRIDLIVSQEGVTNYIEFSPEALVIPADLTLFASSTNLPCDIVPPVRGFHAAVMCADSKFSNEMKRSTMMEKKKIKKKSYGEDFYSHFAKRESAFADQSMVIHGGISSDGKVLGDLWRFSFNTRQWQRLSTFSVTFDPNIIGAHHYYASKRLNEENFRRADHSIVLLGGHLIFVGGMAAWDSDNLETDDKSSSHGCAKPKERRLRILDLKSSVWNLDTLQYEFLTSPKFAPDIFNTKKKISEFLRLLKNKNPSKFLKEFEQKFLTGYEIKAIENGEANSLAIENREEIIKRAKEIWNMNDFWKLRKTTIGGSNVYSNKKIFHVGGIMMLDGGSSMDQSMDDDNIKCWFARVSSLKCPTYSKDDVKLEDYEQDWITGKF
ncbi:hypothetical protein DASC09_005640 [Saccharomycopsis crataegensis]|uniref:Uncharacterized protein n=1 Tax=Saccharomycopsis crataegensis TaxID=43959 RepID=A0AAV5QFW4_9ASCO|nr:hypothetical protein DASC09_005640 [Saccharomycopsis crataegensis]